MSYSSVNFFGKKQRESMESNPIDRREKNICLYPFGNNFRRWITTAFRLSGTESARARAHRSSSRGQPGVPEALHVSVPRGKDAHSSLTSADICSVAAPAVATARAGQRHRATARPLSPSLSRSLPEEFAHSAILRGNRSNAIDD